MNRVVFSPDIFEAQRYGGVSRYFVELAQELKSFEDFEVEVSTGVHINSYLRNSSVNSGIYLPFSPARLKISSAISSLNRSYSRSLTQKKFFDIRHETFYRGGVESLKARKSVTTVYDLIREKFTPNWPGFAAKQLALSRSDAVICISRTTANDLQNFYKVDPSKISVVYLGVSDRFSGQGKSKIRKDDREQLVYIGGRDGYKDFKTLIFAFSQSNFLRKNFRVLVFGAKFTTEEVKLMHSHKVFGCFIHTNGGEDALITAYRHSLGLVITSTYEGFGLTVLEAMMAGCTVISTGGGSLGEIAEGFDLRFKPSNPESLAETIKWLLHKHHSLQDLKNRALTHAQGFTWTKTAENTLAVYKQLIN